VAFYEWQKIYRPESYPGVSLYPIGMAVSNQNLDLGLEVKLSNSVGVGIGFQSQESYSCIGYYIGTRYYPKYNKVAISNSVNTTALLFNFSLIHEYLGFHVVKLNIGIGIPYIWYIPNRGK
jgi:hypothetical protein